MCIVQPACVSEHVGIIRALHVLSTGVEASSSTAGTCVMSAFLLYRS
jgi:hypothetical protein